MSTNEISNPDTDWSIDSPECPFCSSQETEHLVIETRERTIIEGDVLNDEWAGEEDLLQVRCGDCDKLLYRSDEFIEFLRAKSHCIDVL